MTNVIDFGKEKLKREIEEFEAEDYESAFEQYLRMDQLCSDLALDIMFTLKDYGYLDDDSLQLDHDIDNLKSNIKMICSRSSDTKIEMF